MFIYRGRVGKDIGKEVLQYVAQLLWNLADISMLKRLIRARLSQTQQKTEITRSAVN